MTQPAPWHRNLIATLRRKDPLGHFASYRLSAGTVELQPADRNGLDGLVCSHVVPVAVGDARLYTYWLSEAHFSASEPLLLKRLGIAHADCRGPTTQVAPKPPPWWKEIKPWAVVLTLSGLAGAFEVLSNHYERAFATPHLTIRPNAAWTAPIEGEPLGPFASVENKLGSVAHQDLEFNAELRDGSGKAIRLSLLEAAVPWLGPNGSTPLSSDTLHVPAGRYLLHVTARGRAGFLNRAAAFEADVPVRVWPRVATVELRKANSHVGWARYTANIVVGAEAAKGLHCELQVLGVPGLRFTGQIGSTELSSYDRALRLAGDGASSVAVLTWRTKPLNARTITLTEIELIGSPSVDWDALVKQATVVCIRPERKHVPYPSL